MEGSNKQSNSLFYKDVICNIFTFTFQKTTRSLLNFELSCAVTLSHVLVHMLGIFKCVLWPSSDVGSAQLIWRYFRGQ